ncbi:MAG: hypothetical protein ACTHON_18255 [Humibacter sp.]
MTLALTPDQRFAVLLALLTAALAAIGWLTKCLFSVTQQWARTGARLEELSNDIRDLVNAKERDHSRIETRIDRIEGRVERHETWHQDH